MTDRGAGASLLPYMPAGVMGNDDNNDAFMHVCRVVRGFSLSLLLPLLRFIVNLYSAGRMFQCQNELCKCYLLSIIITKIKPKTGGFL